MTIRFAKEEDAGRLLEIYAPYLDTDITFEYEIPSEEEFLRRVREISGDYPYLVWEEDGVIRGYAYAHRHMERAAYQWNAELSVYLEIGRQGRGAGTRLYQALMEILKLQNIKNVYGCVTYPNPSSDHMHDRLGFHLAGRYRKAGYKCGSWHAVSWYEKEIGEHEAEPEPFLPLWRLPEGQAEEVLRRYSK